MDWCGKPSALGDNKGMAIELQNALYVVATPIGCLQDISARALDVLAGVDWVAAEDTRQTGKLLQFFGIKQRLIALHAHNEQRQAGRLVARLQSGEKGALVSDAGTPLVSDPGSFLVSNCHDSQICVVPVPGACAAIAAVSAAGFLDSAFVFHGFLPVKGAARRTDLQGYQYQSASVVFYEAPQRIEALLDDVVTVLGGERVLVLAREITKKFESIVRDRADKIVELLKNDANMKRGEFVLVLGGVASIPPDEVKAKQVWEVVSKRLSHKDAVQMTSEITGVSKKVIYGWGIKSS